MQAHDAKPGTLVTWHLSDRVRKPAVILRVDAKKREAVVLCLQCRRRDAKPKEKRDRVPFRDLSLRTKPCPDLDELFDQSAESEK